jgi:hypothetical protein
VSGRDKARNTAPGTKGTIKQSARDATGKPHAEEMEQGGPTRAQNVSIGAPQQVSSRSRQPLRTMTSLCQLVRRDFVSGAASRDRLAGAGGRRLGCGPGVANRKISSTGARQHPAERSGAGPGLDRLGAVAADAGDLIQPVHGFAGGD